MGSAMGVWIGNGPLGTTAKPCGLVLMPSSRRFGPNFSYLAWGWQESIDRRPIRMQLA